MLSSGYAILYQKGKSYVLRAIFYLKMSREQDVGAGGGGGGWGQDVGGRKQAKWLGHRVHRVATAAFWGTFSHEGKISPGW